MVCDRLPPRNVPCLPWHRLPPLPGRPCRRLCGSCALGHPLPSGRHCQPSPEQESEAFALQVEVLVVPAGAPSLAGARGPASGLLPGTLEEEAAGGGPGPPGEE